MSNTDSGCSTFKSQVPDQQRPINTPHICSTVSLEDNSIILQPEASISVATNKSQILQCSRVSEILPKTSTAPSRPPDVNQTTAPTHTTDGPPLVAEVKITNLPPEVKSLPKPVEVKLAISESNVSSTAKYPDSEEGTLLKSPERTKPPRKKPGGGWARLMKHLVVEPDEPTFPEPQKTEGKEEKTEEAKGANTEAKPQSKGLRANKMWDALLYHISTSSKGQEKPASGEGSTTETASAPAAAPSQFPFLRFRLPLLLHRPRFDARKLKEAASRPLRRVTSFFHRRITDKSSGTFNRTASGWSIKGDDAEQENTGQDLTEVKKE